MKRLAVALFIVGLFCLAQSRAQIPNNKMVGFGAQSTGGIGGNDSCTKILLNMDGANAGTTFTDSNAGGGPHTWTATTATTSTAQIKFGTASFLGAPGKISTTYNANMDIGSADFTVDFWFNRNGTTGAKALAGDVFSTGLSTLSLWFVALDTSNRPLFEISQGGGGFKTITGASGITGSAWHHVAAVKSSTTGYLFIDGTQVGTVTGVSASLPAGTSAIPAVGRLGSWTGYPDFNAYIDEFRLSVGPSCGARWTSNFTPPTSAYTVP